MDASMGRQIEHQGSVSPSPSSQSLSVFNVQSRSTSCSSIGYELDHSGHGNALDLSGHGTHSRPSSFKGSREGASRAIPIGGASGSYNVYAIDAWENMRGQQQSNYDPYFMEVAGSDTKLLEGVSTPNGVINSEVVMDREVIQGIVTLAPGINLV